MSAEVKITKDNRKAVSAKVSNAIETALTIIGGMAEGYAQDSLTDQKAVDTGWLRNSVSSNVGKDGNKYIVEVGTNVEYAPYVETGTGIYYDGSLGGSGRRTSWIWYDEEGNAHKTSGMEARPFIKPAIADHLETYQRVIKDELSGL